MKNKLNILICLLMLLSFQFCSGTRKDQKKADKNKTENPSLNHDLSTNKFVEKDSVVNESEPSPQTTSSNTISQNIEDYLPENYVKDGSVDYTSYIQRAIDENSTVIFPAFPLLVNENGLILRSNQTLDFPEKSLLIMKPNNLERYGILNMIDVDHVTIKNPKLKGDRSQHLGNKGEWGMGIDIRSSSNIKIINPQINDSWGDAIYIGEIRKRDYKKYNVRHLHNENILVKGGILDNNRRNGISVISVKGLTIDGTLIKNTSGTRPMAGIDIEPNRADQHIEDIVIRNVITQNNKEKGISYVPYRFWGDKNKNTSILIENTKDYGSGRPLNLAGITYKKQKELGAIKKMTGSITIKNYEAHDNKVPFAAGSIQKYSPEVKLINYQVFKNNARDSKAEAEVKKMAEKRNFKVQ